MSSPRRSRAIQHPHASDGSSSDPRSTPIVKNRQRQPPLTWPARRAPPDAHPSLMSPSKTRRTKGSASSSHRRQLQFEEPVHTALEAQSPVIQGKKPAEKNVVHVHEGSALGESSCAFNCCSKPNLSSLVFLLPGNPPEAPRITLYPLEAPPGEDRMVRREKLFLFNGYPSVEPRVLHVFTDGTYTIDRTSPPSDSYRLQLIGHSRGQVCFRNPAEKQIYVWDLETETVKRVVKDVEVDGGEIFSYGFGHKVTGLFMVIRLGHPHDFDKSKRFKCYIDTFVEGEKWKRAETVGICDFDNVRPATFVRRDHMLYWKATKVDGAYIVSYDLEAEILGEMVAPLEHNRDLVLGHGFKGQLAAAVFVPPTEQGFSFLHVWVLMKEVESSYWQKIVAFPSNDYISEDEVFVPLVFYYGKDDGAINLVLHRNGEELVRIIPANGKVEPLNSSFRKKTISSVGIKFELGSWREFQATPLGSLQYRSNLKLKAAEVQSPKKIKVCCQDDDT